MSYYTAAKEKVGNDLKDYMLQNSRDLAESHLEAWKDRYALMSSKAISTDLYVNHDPSLEVERIEQGMKRKLNSTEYDYAVNKFNEAVLKIRK